MMQVSGRRRACRSPDAIRPVEVTMANQQRQVVEEPRTEPTGCLPGLVRLVWMAVGNFALLFCAMFIARGTAPVVMDIAFWAVAVGVIVVRYIDITRFHGETSEATPATLADWRQYSVRVAVASAVLWVFARFVAARGWL
jgi:hypothetical protein